MIAARRWGNTRYRGQIIWMLLTSRPDLLPIDLKRQGRAEVHIPLFYPFEEAEIRQMFEVMARKNKLTIAADALPRISADRNLSGADIESISLWRLSERRWPPSGPRGDSPPTWSWQPTSSFPRRRGLEKELQEIAAVLECTQMSLLPPAWRKKVTEPEGRTRLQERLAAIRQVLES